MFIFSVISPDARNVAGRRQGSLIDRQRARFRERRRDRKLRRGRAAININAARPGASADLEKSA